MKNAGYLRYLVSVSMREKCPYSEFFWSVFPLIQKKYGEMLCILPHLVWMLENTDQKNSEYGHFSRSVLIEPWPEVG